MKLKLFSIIIFLCSFFSFGQTFFMVGAATVAGWDSSNPVSMHSNNNLNTVYTYLTTNQFFRFLGQKNWQPINYSLDATNIRNDYRYFKSVSNNITTEFTDNENMKFTGATGYYRIEINSDFDSKTLSIIPQPAIYNDNFQELYLVGSMQGWNPQTAIVIPADPSGIGRYKTFVNIPDGAEFRIYGQKAWQGVEYGNLGFEAGYTGFIGYGGNNYNNNFKINGGNSFHSIEIDLRRGTIKITNLDGLATTEANSNAKQITFSPNPAKDKIRFSKEVKSVSIFDLSGKLVQTSSVNGKELNISTLKSGNYILKITNENGILIEKLVKE